MQVVGIDIGGSGIKGALVDTDTGELVTERFRLPTPEGALPKDVAEVTRQVVDLIPSEGPIGAGFPAVVLHGITYTAANVDSEWIGLDAQALLRQAVERDLYVVNDADAAGLAEMRFGAGRQQRGVVILLTIGTGIGSAIFVDGQLVPNTEFGHMTIRGKDAEWRASDAARQRKDMSWEKYARRMQELLSEMEKLFWPDLFIIGGGISKNAHKFFPLLETRAPIVPAQLLNQAGIVGAAMYAHECGLAAASAAKDAAIGEGA